MTAARYDFINTSTVDRSIEKGGRCTKVLTFRQTNADGTPGAVIDISNYTAVMQIRESYGGALIMTLTTSDYITLSDAANGQMTIEIPPEITSAVTQREGVYDLFVTDALLKKKRLLYGNVEFAERVTTS